MLDIRPDEVVFNGVAFQYKDHPLPVTAGERARIYFVNAGPSLWSSFHVIGGMFEKIYPDDDAAHAQSGVSTYTVGPGAGAVFDVDLSKPGNYPFVDHSFAHLMKGAVGVLAVRAPAGKTLPEDKPKITTAPTQPSAAKVTETSAAPYVFDAKKGDQLYQMHCAACHQAGGTGLPGAFPALKGDAVVLNKDPAEHIDTVLHGLHGKAIDGVTYAAPMPPFAGALSDREIADIVNHERTSWGNQTRKVTAEEVAARRQAK
jgi:nitrite reductase (NO-forming)